MKISNISNILKAILLCSLMVATLIAFLAVITNVKPNSQSKLAVTPTSSSPTQIISATSIATAQPTLSITPSPIPLDRFRALNTPQAGLPPIPRFPNYTAIATDTLLFDNGTKLKFITPTVAVGQQFTMPYSLKVEDRLTMTRTDQPPVISFEKAMRQIYNNWGSADFAFGGKYNNTTLAITVTYGIATVGHPGPRGGWVGPRLDMFIVICEDNQQCYVSKEPFYRGNRPVWIFDYGNISTLPRGCFGPDECKFHSVIVVDAELGAVMYYINYDADVDYQRRFTPKP